MKKSFLAVLVLGLLVLAASAACAADPIKVGYLANLTGEERKAARPLLPRSMERK